MDKYPKFFRGGFPFEKLVQVECCKRCEAQLTCSLQNVGKRNKLQAGRQTPLCGSRPRDRGRPASMDLGAYVISRKEFRCLQPLACVCPPMRPGRPRSVIYS